MYLSKVVTLVGDGSWDPVYLAQGFGLCKLHVAVQVHLLGVRIVGQDGCMLFLQQGVYQRGLWSPEELVDQVLVGVVALLQHLVAASIVEGFEVPEILVEVVVDLIHGVRCKLDTLQVGGTAEKLDFACRPPKREAWGKTLGPQDAIPVQRYVLLSLLGVVAPVDGMLQRLEASELGEPAGYRPSDEVVVKDNLPLSAWFGEGLLWWLYMRSKLLASPLTLRWQRVCYVVLDSGFERASPLSVPGG